MTESDRLSELEMEEIEPKSFFARLGGVYASPGAAFKEIGRAPRVLVPLILVILVGFVAGFLVVRFLDIDAMVADQISQMAQQGFPQERIDQAAPTLSIIIPVQISIMFLLGGVIGGLIVSGFAKLFSVIVGAKNRFKALFSVTLYTLLAITTIKYVLLVLIVYLKRPFAASIATLQYAVASNLNGLLTGILGEGYGPKYLMALASYIDLFTIWSMVVLAIGYSAVSKKLKTGTAAAWLFIAYAIMSLIGAVVLSKQV